LVLSETSPYHTHTHTHIILPQHFTNKQLLFSHHTTSHLTCSEKLPLHQRHLTRSNCWTLGHWMLGSPVAGMTSLACLENLPRPHDITGCPCSFALAVPNQFKYPVWGQEPGSLTHTHRRLLTEEHYSVRLIITQLKQVVMQCNVIISVVLWLNYLQTSLFITTYHTSHL
jgi:hypothetical protein